MRFRNYFNRRGKHKRIYTIDDLYNMNLGDFIDKEDELDYQDRTIGLPFEDELKLSNNVRYIQGYTRDDGNTIPSYWEGINDNNVDLNDLMSNENMSQTNGNILDNLNNSVSKTVPNLNNTYGNNFQPIKSFTGVKNTWNNSNNNLNNQNVNSPDFSEIKPTEPQENILSGYVTNGNNALNNGKSMLEGYITNTPDVVETEQQDLPTTYWDSKGNAQKVDENGNPIADSRGLWQKVSDELTKSAYNIDNRINRPTEDQQKRDTELLLALLTSPLGGEYAAAKLAPKLVPYLGKQVAKSVMTGLGSGVVGGGAEGLSWGLHEGENPFISMTRDALLGGLAGVVGGYGFGKVNKAITDIPRKKELEELLAKQKVWGIPYRSASGNPEDAIDVLYKNKQGFVPKAYQKGDDIDFVWGKYTPPKNPNEKGGGYGLAHIEGRRNEEGYNGEKFLRELPELLNKGNKYYKENHTDRFYIGNDEKEAAIKMLYDKNFWKWLTSAYFK